MHVMTSVVPLLAEAYTALRPSTFCHSEYRNVSNPYQSPERLPPQQPYAASSEGDATGGVIPYKNPHALIAYYSSIGTMLCCVTPLPLGIIPLVLGIIGLRKRRENPAIKGSVHAWIGIVLGGLSAICSLIMIVVVGIALLAEANR